MLQRPKLPEASAVLVVPQPESPVNVDETDQSFVTFHMKMPFQSPQILFGFVLIFCLYSMSSPWQHAA